MTPQAVADGTMGTAIQERLRLQADFAQSRAHINSANNCREAADYIDSLEKQRDEAKLKVERLVKALKPFAEILEGFYPGAKDDDLLADADHAITVGDLREADAAIKEAGK